MSIPAFAVRQPVLVNLVAISAVVIGALVMSVMHRESLPTMPTSWGNVTTVYVGASPEEIIFTRALFGDLDLDASGSVTTDSYESDLGTYASQAVNIHGPTGLTFAKANGTLGSNGNISKQGDRQLRWLLIQSATTACQYHPQLRRFYKRLTYRKAWPVVRRPLQA